MCFGRACVVSENIIRVSIFTHADNNRAAREAQHTFVFSFRRNSANLQSESPSDPADMVSVSASRHSRV